jgi:hypothetical protein
MRGRFLKPPRGAVISTSAAAIPRLRRQTRGKLKRNSDRIRRPNCVAVAALGAIERTTTRLSELTSQTRRGNPAELVKKYSKLNKFGFADCT